MRAVPDRILDLLRAREPDVVTFEELGRLVWGWSALAGDWRATVRAGVYHARGKLDRRVEEIESVRGDGYRLRRFFVADPKEILELDLDIRLAGLWADTEGVDEWTLEVAAAYMRAAYAKGYVDALVEPERGKLATDHGYRVPEPEPRA